MGFNGWQISDIALYPRYFDWSNPDMAFKKNAFWSMEKRTFTKAVAGTSWSLMPVGTAASPMLVFVSLSEIF